MTRAVVQNRDGTLSLVAVMAQSRYAVATPLGTFDRGTQHLVNRADYPVLLFVGSEEAEALLGVDPFDSARGHVDIPSCF